MEFGSLIKKYRTERKLTTRELAEKAGISQPYIVQIENNNYVPSPKVLQGIGDALELPVSVLAAALKPELYLRADEVDVEKLLKLQRQVNEITKMLSDFINRYESMPKFDNLVMQYNQMIDHEEISQEISRFAETATRFLNELHQTLSQIESEAYHPEVQAIMLELTLLDSKGREYVRKQIELYRSLFDSKE